MRYYRHLWILIFILFCGKIFPGQLKLIQKLEIETLVKKIVISNDTLYIQTPEEILLFTTTGKEKGQIGSIGEGPGSHKSLKDFDVFKNHIAVADYFNRINIFNEQGKNISIIKVKEFVESVYYLNGKIFYIAKKFIKNKDLGFISQISLREALTEKIIKTFEDSSLIRARIPGNKKYPMPWFPNPFCNRLIILSSPERILALSTRENSFLEIGNNSEKIINLTYNFKKEKVTSKDISRFFNQIEKTNKRQVEKVTRDSVNFPKEKELFIGAINWGEGVAVVTSIGELLVFSRTGKFIDRFDISTALKELSMFGDDIDGFTENWIVLSGNRLYISNSDGIILVFQIVHTNYKEKDNR